MTLGEWIETVDVNRLKYQEGAITAREYYNIVVFYACNIELPIEEGRQFSVYQEGYHEPIINGSYEECENYINQVMNSTHSPAGKLEIRNI